MTETGWPLIPREALPAAVRPAQRRGSPSPAKPAGGDGGRQLPIFGAETVEPSPADLAGLLAGPGRLGRMGGTARVAVRVDAAWRVHVLVAELVRRGLVVSWHEIEEVRGDAPPIVSEVSGSSENQVKEETSVSRPSTFDPDADPLPDLPSDIDFFPDPAEALADPSAPPAKSRSASASTRAKRRSGPASSEVRASEVRASEVRASEVRASEVRASEVRASEVRASEVRASEVRASEVRASEVREAQVREAQAREAQAREAQARAEASPVEARAETSAVERLAQAGATAGATAGNSGNSLPEPPGDSAVDPEESEPPPPALRFEVVTAYSSRLDGLARAWPETRTQLFLSGPRLRLWVAAAGEPVPGGYALGLDVAKNSPDELRAIDAALVRAGLGGRFSQAGWHYVIAGQRRIMRLAELVGERPEAVPPGWWPGGAGA